MRLGFVGCERLVVLSWFFFFFAYCNGSSPINIDSQACTCLKLPGFTGPLPKLVRECGKNMSISVVVYETLCLLNIWFLSYGLIRTVDDVRIGWVPQNFRLMDLYLALTSRN